MTQQIGTQLVATGACGIVSGIIIKIIYDLLSPKNNKNGKQILLQELKNDCDNHHNLYRENVNTYASAAKKIDYMDREQLQSNTKTHTLLKGILDVLKENGNKLQVIIQNGGE